MRKWCLFIILILFIPLLTAQLSYIQSFFYKESEITSSFTYDVNGDGPREVIVGSRNLVRLPKEQGQSVEYSEGFVTLLDSHGKTIWRFDTDSIDNDKTNNNGRAVLSVAAGDLKGDGTRLILLGTEKEKETFLAADFTSYNTHVPPFPPEAIADFPVDVYTSYVYALRADGTLFWTSEPIYNDNVKMLFVSDLNSDGRREVVAVCFYAIYLFNYDGKYFWNNPPATAYRLWSSASKIHDIAIDDTDMDGRKEIAVASKKVYLVEDTGILTWEYPATSDLPADARTVYIADVDSNIESSSFKDPNPEILAGAGNFVYVFDEGGSLQWSYETPAPVSDVIVASFFEPKNILIASEYTVTVLRNDVTVLSTFVAPARVSDIIAFDLNLDGQNELVLSGDGLATIYDRGINAVWTSRLGELFIAASLADLDLDGYMEIIETYNGTLYAYRSQKNLASEGDRLFSEAESYLAKKEYSNALIYFQRARDKYKDLGDNRGMATAEDMVAKCEKYIAAQQLYDQAEKLFGEHKYAEAKPIFKGAEDAFRKVGETEMVTLISSKILACENYLLADSYLAKAETLFAQHAFQDAEFFASQARDLYSSLADIEKIQKANTLLSKTTNYKQAAAYFQEGEKRLLKKDYSNALSYLTKAEKLYEELGDMELLEKTRERITSAQEVEKKDTSFVAQYKQYLIVGGALAAFIIFVFLLMLLLILKKQG